MRIRALLAMSGALAAAACTPELEKSPPPAVTHARFNPATSPATLPTPNMLAINPQTGKVEIPLPDDASDADRQFVAFLATLDGFPADSPGEATFDGKIDPASVTSETVRVLDITDPAKPTPVTDAVVSVAAVPPPGAQAAVGILPPAGWKSGHSYAVVLVGGANGLKAENGSPVVGSSVWAFTRSKTPLVTCSDLTAPDCRSTTALLTNEQAVQLEPLRRSFQPLLDQIEASGIARNDVALAWTFKIATGTVMAFQPSATPPLVPTPNDLAIDPSTGTLQLPIDPTTSAANQAFVRDYLNTLNGFPTSTPGSAPVKGGTLDATTVNASSVRVLDLTPASGNTPTPVDAPVTWSAATNAIALSPPSGGWEKGHRYAVVVVGGPSGVKAANGGEVGASSVWALARGTAPLATCADPTNPACVSNVHVVTISDDSAARLEQLRSGLAPLLDALAAQGIPREQIPIAWTFRIYSNPEARFDPAAEVIPFPNDLLREVPADGGTPHVALPIPDGGSPELQALLAGLNTLDGFSTTAPAVSENSLSEGPLTNGARIDPASLDAGTAFVRLATSGAPQIVQTEPQVAACLDCASSLLPDGGTQVGGGGPEALQFVPQVPLDEQTTYAALLTRGLRAADGTPVVATATFALIRSPEPLVDSSGKSTIAGVSDAQAAQAEPLRLALKPMFDALDAQGFPRSSLVLAWSFTTQSTVSQLAQLRGLNDAADIPTTPIAFAVSSTLPVTGNLSAVYEGEVPTAFALTGPGGTLNPTGAEPQVIPFVLALPKAPAGNGGYPVAVFAHGLGRHRFDALAIADALGAAGIATIAVDHVWHGDRTSCTGSAAALRAAGIADATDDFACGGVGASPDPTAQRCDEGRPIGRCVKRSGNGDPCTYLSPTAEPGEGGDLFCMSVGQGRCRPRANGAPGPSFCEGGDFWRRSAGEPPVISGWNIFDTQNLFTTRDNLRQPVIDLEQVVRMVKSDETGSLNELLAAAGASGTLDRNQIHFIGQSLGAIMGTGFNAVSPDTRHVVLNVPAGDLPGILLTTQSPGLVAARTSFFEGLAAQGIQQGTPQFDQFIGFARWILDPADPLNSGVYLWRGISVPQTERKALVQFIEGDQTLPNPTTQALVDAIIRPGFTTCAQGAPPPCADVFEFTDAQFGATLPDLPDRHGFLLNGASAEATADAQGQAVQYLTQGTVKTTFP